MARYIKKEIVDLNGTGKKQAYYRMQTWRKLDHEEFVKKCTYVGSGVSRAMMDAVLTVIADELPRLLAMGYSVRIDGLGTFNAKLGVRKMRLLTNNPVKRVGLEAYGLEIVENVPIEVKPNEYNLRYLKTKKDRMGHILHL